jgi:hypothetical protein
MHPTEPTQADVARQYMRDAEAVLRVHEALGYPGLTQDEVAQRQLARASVAATLALAEEQRTANLIARAAFGYAMATNGAAQSIADLDDLRAVLANIDARLTVSEARGTVQA